MTISTMEQLEALPPGSTIRVRQTPGSAECTKMDDGTWVRDIHATLNPVSRIPSAMFTGLVAEGRVDDNSNRPPVPGDVYVNVRRMTHHYHYLVTRAPRDGVVGTMRFRDGLYLSDENLSVATIDRTVRRVPVSDTPPWVAAVWSALQPLIAREAAAQEQVRFARTQTESANARLTEMEEAQTNLPGTVWVQVTGTSQVPTEKADGHVPQVAVLDSVVARWHATLSLDTRGPGCLCGQVTRDWVMEQLGIDVPQLSGTFEYERDCGRHD